MSTHPLTYQTGFANDFATEALPGALPVGRNSPQRCPYGLYAEQLTGSAFTAPRSDNRRSWFYRIRPTAMHAPFTQIDNGKMTNDFSGPTSPNQMRWDPLPEPNVPVDFLQSWVTMAGSGDPHAQSGVAIHLYAANASMVNRSFYNSDGELLIVLQQGRQRFVTEMGIIDAEPHEIVLIPRGVRFRVELLDGAARGYICENFGAPFRLPDLGVIGSNGLANPRDFQTPTAWYEDVEGEHLLVNKFMGNLWQAPMTHSPLDVVAWHGNFAPYKYDLRRHNTIGSISYDHPDPSIFLVLHSASNAVGVSDIDFVIFPPRILAMQNTFRPPWFHRNIASEFMGLVHGAYDAKTGELEKPHSLRFGLVHGAYDAKTGGFVPGGASLHNCMSSHGPDAGTFEKASAADTSQADYIQNTMAFMFETRCALRPTPFAMHAAALQQNYYQCWQNLQKHFTPNKV